MKYVTLNIGLNCWWGEGKFGTMGFESGGYPRNSKPNSAIPRTGGHSATWGILGILHQTPCLLASECVYLYCKMMLPG